MTSCAQCGYRLSGEPTCPMCGLEIAAALDQVAEADSTDVEERTPPVSAAANDDVTPESDEPNESTVIRKPVEAIAPDDVDDVPAAEQTSLSLPRISAYGDDDRPGPAASMAASAPDEPTERTTRRQAPGVDEQLDIDDEPDGSTAIRPAFAPPTTPPPATPPPAHATEEAVIPDPEPSPLPDPEPSPVPEPTPDPIPEPGPVPEPVPDPVPEPTPEPVPAPEPVSETTAEAAYLPFVQPSGMLVEARNGQARHWAPPEEAAPEATLTDQAYEAEPAYATGYAEDAYTAEDAGDWQAGYGYAEQEPLEQDFGDYGAQQEYVSSLMASEPEDNPSTWAVLLWVGAIFMIVLLVLGIWLMTL